MNERNRASGQARRTWPSLVLDRSGADDISRLACEKKNTRPAGNSSLPASLRFLGETFRTVRCLRGKKMDSGDLIYGPAESETGRQAGLLGIRRCSKTELSEPTAPVTNL